MVRVSIKKRGNIYHAKVQDGFAVVRFTLRNWDHVKGLISLVKYLSVTNMFLTPYCYGEIMGEYTCYNLAEELNATYEKVRINLCERRTTIKCYGLDQYQ